jgi:transposase-like protein
MANVMRSVLGRPETEVTEKGKRRRFTAEYKQRILREAGACKEPGAVGALLRREGLYSSHLTYWRKEAGRGELAALTPKKRGPQAKVVDAKDRQLAEQQRETMRWKRRAERAEALVEVQKKLSQLLGIALPTLEDEKS